MAVLPINMQQRPRVVGRPWCSNLKSTHTFYFLKKIEYTYILTDTHKNNNKIEFVLRVMHYTEILTLTLLCTIYIYDTHTVYLEIKYKLIVIFTETQHNLFCLYTKYNKY